MLLFGCVVASLTIWCAELFYWVTITFSQTLGTALGDWTTDTGGLGYAGAALVFEAVLVVIAGLYFST